MDNLESFLSQAGAALSTESIDPTSQAAPKSKFMNRQFTLFQLPVASLYLKGAMPLLGSDPTLADALEAAFPKRLGGAKHATLSSAILAELTRSNRAALYTAKGMEFHIELVNACIETGLPVSKSRALCKTTATQTLTEYLAARTEHYRSLGFGTLEEWLDSLTLGTATTSDDLLALPLHTIEDLDW